ncbi:MAG: hypothetical protein RR891_05680 [Clostridium sp.]|uniref:hypothetical protein n=1 Tax=Clostridium sp. TaxID=1506 RepID=UPI00305E9779
MIIDIKDKGAEKSTRICIPRFCISMGAFILPLALQSKFITVSKNGTKEKNRGMNKQQAKIVKEAIKQLNKNYPGLVLVDIQSSDGETIKIVI